MNRRDAIRSVLLGLLAPSVTPLLEMVETPKERRDRILGEYLSSPAGRKRLSEALSDVYRRAVEEAHFRRMVDGVHLF